jgi:hypothetical protein
MTEFRRTKGILTESGDPKTEADVIMTAALLGFSAWRLGDPADRASTLGPLDTGPVRFDADPGTPQRPISNADRAELETGVNRLQRAVAAYLGTLNTPVSSGLSGSWSEGACIMGVYTAAGQKTPADISKLEQLSKEGAKRWREISSGSDIKQYTGRGAYTGFVDDPNGSVVAGPMSTARFWASAALFGPERWVPELDLSSSPWRERIPRKVNPTDPDPAPFAWGLIGGDLAAPSDPKSPTAAQITHDMEYKYHMVFDGKPAQDGVDVAMYTHGMIQSIYLAYGHGPSCRAYEIAVGTQTTKMASCFLCSMFMSANGYFPSSIHLGRGESWTPLFAPYVVPGTKADPQVLRTLAVTISDLNNSWYERCLLWLQKGLTILTDAEITQTHRSAKSDLAAFLSRESGDPTLGGRLILDAVTMHDSELTRVVRTLRP